MYDGRSRPEWRFDDFGLESPFSQEAPARPAGTNASLAKMLALPGRFDDPARDRAVEFDGTRFEDFLSGGETASAFAARWLASRPALASAAGKPSADLKATDIAKAWFVIHDVGAGGSLTDERYTAAALRKEEEEELSKARKGVKGARRFGFPVHGFLNRLGSYAALHDFAETRSGTVFEFATNRGKQICQGLTINIETVPDIETIIPPPAGSPPPPKDAAKYASIGHAVIKVRRKVGGVPKAVKAFQYFKWTHEAFDVLADLYILASSRAGHLLTVCAHKEMDRNLARSVIWREHTAAEFRRGVAKDGQSLVRARDKFSDYHGDPYGFDMQAFYDVVATKLNGLGGRQLPAGARFGVHPARLRKASGANIGNLDGQKNTFPFQSHPTIPVDRDLKPKGWWNIAAAKGEDESDEDEFPFSGLEVVSEDELSLEACASHFAEDSSELENTFGEEPMPEPEAETTPLVGGNLDEERFESWEEPFESWQQPLAEELDWLELGEAGETPQAELDGLGESPFASEAYALDATSEFDEVEEIDSEAELADQLAEWGQERFDEESWPATFEAEEETPEILGGTNATTSTVKLYHYGDLSNVSEFKSPIGYPRLTDYDGGRSQLDAATYTGTPIGPKLKYKYELVIDEAYFNKHFAFGNPRKGYIEYGTRLSIPVRYFTRVATLTISSPTGGGSSPSGGLPPATGGGRPGSTTSTQGRLASGAALTVMGLNVAFNWVIGALNERRMQQRLDAIANELMQIRQNQPTTGVLLVFRFRAGTDSGEGPTAARRFEGLTYLTALSEDDALAKWRSQPRIEPGMLFEFKWIAPASPVAVRPAGWTPAAIAEFADLSRIEFRRMGFAQIGGFSTRGKVGPVDYSRYDFAKGYRFAVLQIPDSIPYYGPGGGLKTRAVQVRQVTVTSGTVPAMIVDGEAIAAVVAANDDTNRFFHAKGAQAQMMIRDVVDALRTVPNIREVRWLKISQIRMIRDVRELRPVPRTDAAR